VTVSPADRRRVLAKLDHLEQSLARVIEYRPERAAEISDDADRLRQSALERVMHLAIQDVLDLAALMVRTEGLGLPSTYREAVERLGSGGLIPRELAERIAPMAGFRNVLEHMYLELDLELLVVYAHRDEDFREFAGAVVAWMER